MGRSDHRARMRVPCQDDDRVGADIRSHRVDLTPMDTAPELVVDVILEAAR